MALMWHQMVITGLCIVVVWQIISLITAIVERRLMACPQCERDGALERIGALDYPLHINSEAEWRCKHCDFAIREAGLE